MERERGACLCSGLDCLLAYLLGMLDGGGGGGGLRSWGVRKRQVELSAAAFDCGRRAAAGQVVIRRGHAVGRRTRIPLRRGDERSLGRGRSRARREERRAAAVLIRAKIETNDFFHPTGGRRRR